jgi:hypothetical protein
MLGLNIFWNIVLAGMLTILTAVGLKLFNINNLILLLRKDQQ